MPGPDGPPNATGQPGIVRAALLGLCPRCSQRTLFEAPARIAFECRDCHLDFAAMERGGRLGGLVTALLATMLIAVAYAVEANFRPPLWLQAAFWAPVTVAVVIYGLRLFKAGLLYASFEDRGRQ